MAISGKYGKLDIPKIAADEPVFILRAQDLLAALAHAIFQETPLADKALATIQGMPESLLVNSIIGPELDRVWNNTETAAEAVAKLKPLLDKAPPETK